jgi:hypothetical protein
MPFLYIEGIVFLLILTQLISHKNFFDTQAPGQKNSEKYQEK